jgi:hypothetical protein
MFRIVRVILIYRRHKPTDIIWQTILETPCIVSRSVSFQRLLND